MMKVVFLGTNGWYDTPTGNTDCIMVETPRAFILLDAGSGLHLLNKFDMPQGLTIHCRKGDLRDLRAVIAPLYSMPFSVLYYPVHFIEHGGTTIETDGFTVRSAPMQHSVPTIGFCFDIDGTTMAYCPDTGHCDNAVQLFREADLLIAECAYRSGEESEHWPHLNPVSAAHLALDAGAKKLVLLYFDAYRYPDKESRLHAQMLVRQKLSGACCVSDEEVVDLSVW